MKLRRSRNRYLQPKGSFEHIPGEFTPAILAPAHQCWVQEIKSSSNPKTQAIFDGDLNYTCRGDILQLGFDVLEQLNIHRPQDTYICEFHLLALLPRPSTHQELIDKLRELATVATEAADLIAEITSKEKN